MGTLATVPIKYRLMSRRTRAWPGFEVIAAILVSLWCGGATVAHIDQLTVTPASPTCADAITIRLDGWFPDACFFVTGTQPTLQVNIRRGAYQG